MECFAEFTLLSSRYSPEDLARAVGLESDHSWRKGERAGPRSRVGRKFNGVTYESHLPPGSTPEQHLANLLDRLRPLERNISSLATALVAEEGNERVVLVWLVLIDSPPDILGLEVVRDRLEFIARLGAGFALDIYPGSEDGEVEPAQRP